MLSITAKKEDLARALDFCRGVVPRRNTMPILANVLIEREGNLIVMTGTDMETEVSTTLAPMTISNVPYGLTLPAQTLHDIVRNAAGDTVEIAYQNSRATVTSGKAKYSLGTLPESDYPHGLAIDGGAATFHVSAADLRHMLETTRHAIETEGIRHYLSGVYLERREKTGLRAVALDGHRMAVVEGRSVNEADFNPVILPKKACAELLRLLEGAAESVQLQVTETKVSFTIADKGLIFTTKLIDGTYPPYERMIPSDITNKARLDKAILAGAVQRVAAIGLDRSKALKLEFTSGKLKLSHRAASGDESVEEIEAAYSGEKFTTGFNCSYLSDVLGRMPAQLDIEFSGIAGPAMLRGCIDEAPVAGEIFVIMPMKV